MQEVVPRETALDRIKKLRAEADKLLEDAKAEALTKAHEAVAELNSLGFPYALTDAPSGRGKGKRAKSSRPPKFRHPTDHNLTWAGKGKTPSWLLELIEHSEGKTKEDFLNPERIT